jgi:hypothetical protein
MSNSIYDLLGFPTNDPILSDATLEFTPDIKMQLNLMPSLVNTWQQEDIANQDTSGYFINPNQIGNNTANAATSIIINSSSMMTPITGNTSQITSLLENANTKASTLLHTTIPAFEYHTQRMSNMVSMGSDMTNPHYELSTGYAKILSFIVYRSDGIEDNSTHIGSFGSILAANAISANANTLLTLSNLYAATINASTTGTGTEGDPYVTVYTSNISLSNAQALSDSADAVYNLMTTYMSQDKTFYTNTKNVIDSYNKVSGFSRLGQTQTDLIMNHIGSDKLKTRLNS